MIVDFHRNNLTSNTKTRILWVDYVRVLACFLVCLIHSPLPDGAGKIWLRAYNYFSAPCIGLFFMLSGALLFPVRGALRPYLIKKTKRIVIPLLFWSVVALSVHCLVGTMDVPEALNSLLKLPFCPVEGVYWFMYAILGLYLFAPLISPALEKDSHVKYMLLLWGITLCMPYLNAWLPGYWDMNRGGHTTWFGMFSGYMGYMALGYYLRHHALGGKRWLIWIICLAVAGIIPICFVDGRFVGVNNEMLYGYLTINVAALCVVYFTFIQWCSESWRNADFLSWINRKMQDISQKSFGIYLVHILIMRDLVWPIWLELGFPMNYSIQIPAVAIISLTLSYLLIKILSFIPYTKYIH